MTALPPVEGLANNKEEFVAKLHEEDTERESTPEELGNILGLTIKRDEPAKLITFHGMLLAQSNEDQFNLGLQAESSTGKSYISQELASYFPETDVRTYAGASPTSFFHSIGDYIPLAELEQKVDLQRTFDLEELARERTTDAEHKQKTAEAEMEGKKPPRDPRRHITFVNLQHKILVFLDQPHWMLMERLRPLLSHDQKILRFDITDKTGKGGLRTKTVVIQGYPTVVFATAKSTREAQEQTRMWLLSPETSQEKIKEALKLLGLRIGKRAAFKQWIDNDPIRRWLKNRIKAIRDSGVREVVVEDWEGLLQEYQKERTTLSPRAMRDWPRLLYLVKGFALYNCFTRRRVGDVIYSNKADREAAVKLYEKVGKSNELGLSPEIYDIYIGVILPLAVNGGVDRRAIQAAYFKRHGRPLSPTRLRREILPALESAGLTWEEPDPADKRKMLVWCTVQAPISGTTDAENNRGRNSAASQVRCEVCGSPGAQSIDRIGEDTPHYLCNEHLSSYSGDF